MMAENSKIEWTDHTFNPWIGCTKVAAGCTHCYAESLAKRTGKAKWGENGTRVKTSEKYWDGPLKWNRDAEKAGQRAKVFCASLADVFEDWSGDLLHHSGDLLLCCDSCGAFHADNDAALIESCKCTRFLQRVEWANLSDVRRSLFQLIDATPHLDWQLLTKRPENIRRMWPGRRRRRNVWLLTSIATQSDADRNVHELMFCRGLVPVLGVSAEPLLGPVDLTRIPTDSWAYGKCDVMSGHLCGAEPDEMYDYDADPHGWVRRPAGEWKRGKLGIDWLIVGGESGHGARPMHPDWARGLRDQCQAAGVPFFFKQWGEWAVGDAVPGGDLGGDMRRGKADIVHRDHHEPDELLKRSFFKGDRIMRRVGKKAAGRLLDGRTWDEFPTEAA